jgi:N-acetylneuraminic acid mutarotase
LDGATFIFYPDHIYRSQGSCGGGGTPTRTATFSPPTATATCAVGGGGGTPGPWATAAPAATDFYGGGSASNGTLLYVAGGYSFSSGLTINDFRSFNPATNTWTPLAPAPTAVIMPSLVYAPNVNKVFMFGGEDAVSGVNSNATSIYDVAAGTWSAGASMPDVRSFMMSGYYNGKIYLVGGYNTSQVTSSQSQVWEYDPVANTFNTTRMNMPAALGGGGSGVINGHLYVAGGRDGTTVALNTLYDYDIAANSWSTKATLLAGTNVPGSGVINGKLFIYGGGNPFSAGGNGNGNGNTVSALVKGQPSQPSQPRTTNQTQYYDPGTNTWTNGNPMTSVRAFPSGTNVGNTYLVAVGGYNGATTVNTTEMATAQGGGGCGTPTNTPPPVNTPTRTNTPPVGPSPTCVASAGGWTAGPDLPNPPQVLVRAVGVYFPTNGKFYSIGGRTSDVAGSDYQKVLEYTPGNPGTWVQKGVTLPDNNMNNMACGVLTVSGTPQIYCVGGSFAGGTSATARVFSYNPATDTATTLAAGDNWPGNAAGTILPGGFAVANNKLYILGGFNINVASTNQIWEFDPTLGVGAKWTQKVNAPAGIMYAPAATIGGIIYVGGASDYQTGTVVDTNTSFSFNPVANTIGTIATIPRATGETRGVVVGGNMWVLGGGRVAPNPSTEVDVYNPGTNTWSVGSPFSTARRNFPADSDGSTVWLAGGYASDGLTPLGSMEIFRPAVPCSSPTPGQNTPTNTPQANTPTRTATGAVNTPTRTSVPGTATNTPPVGASPTNTPPGPPPTITPGGPTPTTCPIQFSDVPVGSTFYEFIRCLACRGIINGYPDGTFRPNNNVTRGQLSKIVSNSAGFSDPATQMFEDVPPGSTFFDYIGRLASRGYINGYPCGGPGEPCVPPGNLPYFRPNANATRGQISKIVSNAAGFIEPVSGQTFQDVPPGSTFYDFIERLASRGVMSGYPCGSIPTEPCVPPENRPYFRPNNNATRGQTSKIVSNTFFPACVTPRVVVARRLLVTRHF